ncbi:hypothetical protein E4U09_003992 [Claviceps aff. purpurea]|uniref:Myb-like domain-containing protein n=1 Tax=Claviceps aff. purpurea TaxID=1967640 RepID=A0A9P7QFN7_9HYPO|nr:hypothetical protein E4U09_003992 [Claviceps aff. purpurea]
MESQSLPDMGNTSPLLHWMDNPTMPYEEPSPIFQDPDGQFYSLGMDMPMYDGEGRGYLSDSYMANSFYAHVDSGSPSREMDYICSSQIYQPFEHANDYTDSQSQVSFDYSSFPIDGSANLALAGEVVGLVSTETERNSCWDHPGLASRARQFLEIPSQQPEPIADPNLSWAGSYIDPSMSPGLGSSSSLSMHSSDAGSSAFSIPSAGIGLSSLGMPSPGIGLSSLGMPSPGIDSLSLSMPSLSRSPHTEDNINQSSTAQPSYAGQSLQVPRDFLSSSSPVSAQPAITSAKEYQDQVLLHDRQNGWSYKQIKTIRNFGVSESTLRGRHRTLLKGSHQRPRKPIWTLADVELLKIAVPRFTSAAGSRRVSWKAVSEFIHTNGDSPYAFAYATCHKKWREVTKRGIV